MKSTVGQKSQIKEADILRNTQSSSHHYLRSMADHTRFHIPKTHYYHTQGNYATEDSSGMCHLMPHQHLPEWWEEEEWAFVHCGSGIPNKGIDNSMSTALNEVTKKWWMALWKALWQIQLDITARSSSLHSGRCCHGIMWHMPLLSWVASFTCVIQCFSFTIVLP